MQVDLYTGRPHQIRIHLAYAGHPLVGDPLYVKGGLPKALSASVINSTVALSDDAVIYREPEPALFANSQPSRDLSSGSNMSECQRLETSSSKAERLQGMGALPGDCGYILHAARIDFEHPVTRARIVVEAFPYPPELDVHISSLPS